MELSIILINYDWNLCKDTLKSIKGSMEAASYTTENLEVRIADFTSKQYIPKSNNPKQICTKIYHMNADTKSFSQIVQDSKGYHIMFLEAGDTLDIDFFKNLQKQLSKEPAAVTVLNHEQMESNPLMKVIQDKKYLNLRDNYRFSTNLKQAFIIARKELDIPCDISSLEGRLQVWCMITYALAKIQSAKILSGCEVILSPAYTIPSLNGTSIPELTEFFQVIGSSFQSLFENKMGSVPRILQHQQILCIAHLLNVSPLLIEELSTEQLKNLDTEVIDLILHMDFDVLLTASLNRAMVLYACQQKPQANLQLVFTGQEYFYYAGNQKLLSVSRYNFKVQFIAIHGNRLYLEGISGTLQHDDSCEVWVSVNGKMYPTTLTPHNSSIFWLDHHLSQCNIFTIELDLDPKEKVYDISFHTKHDDYLIEKNFIQFGKYAPIEGTLEGSYYYRDGWMIEYDTENGHLKATTATAEDQIKKEKAFQTLLSKHSEVAARKAALVRKAYFTQKKFDKRDVWLISDRTNRGDDNGEAFFRYVMQQKKRLKDKDIYFVLEKDSSSYPELKKLGKVITPMSWKHKMLHLRSSYVISSQGNDPVVNPFHKKHIYYKDLLCDMKFVFLQHGITKDNQSAWLNKYNRNIYGLITSTQEEYDSMLEYDYYYTEDRIWLTGMPRYDLLYHDEKKYITIMPTWRKSLMSGTDVQTGIWQLKEGFEESSYLKFYNALLNHEKLISEAKKLGYKICFMPHPNIAPYVSYFTKHPDVEFFDAAKSYRQVFAEADMMLTDYSSVAFDFAYLRKPIVYSQFDYKEFFSGSHSYTEGYFDYERDGFGEITHDLESTVDLIIEYMKNNCELKPLYRERIDHTFAFPNDKCSEHVLKKLLGEE